MMRSGCIAHQRVSLSSSSDSSSNNDGDGGTSSSNGANNGGTAAAAGHPDDHYELRRSCGGGSDANAWARLSEQQLRDLVQEMSKKMEYTERMNWLCKCAYQTVHM